MGRRITVMSLSAHFAAAAAALVMTGCQGAMRVWEGEGIIRVEPSQSAGSDFVVHMRNVVDPGYNPDDPVNRHKLAKAMVSTQCPAARIVRESEIVTGTYGTGKTSKVYSVFLRCR